MSLEHWLARPPPLEWGGEASRVRELRLQELTESRYASFHEVFANLPVIQKPCWDLKDSVRLQGIGSEADITHYIESLVPWKKGPFFLLDQKIDSEWQSHWKWERLVPHIDPLQGHRVCDIGCNNGYFMFRMAYHQPEYVVGIEPQAKQWFVFHSLLTMGGEAEVPLFLERLGIEHLGELQEAFDTIFCLGILYHHTDPVGLLRILRKALAKKGQLIIDCQGIAGEDPFSLIPRSRYAGASGIWQLPTITALKNWIYRVGFQNVDVLYAGKLTPDEQRSTRHAPIKSLNDFLDPKNLEKTIEGYPAPYRFYLRVS